MELQLASLAGGRTWSAIRMQRVCALRRRMLQPGQAPVASWSHVFRGCVIPEGVCESKGRALGGKGVKPQPWVHPGGGCKSGTCYGDVS